MRSIQSPFSPFSTGSYSDDFDVLLDQWRSLRDDVSKRKLRDTYEQYIKLSSTPSGKTVSLLP